MHEASKSIFSRLADSRYATRYFVGEGIDIGAGDDPLALYKELFPLMKSCQAWDRDDGDAQMMEGVPDASVDFIHSAHCLEHLVDPREGLGNWLRILRPGGHMVCIVPDEDLYEQGVFPSTFNEDHRHTFTINKRASWSPVSINLLDLLSGTKAEIAILKIALLDATYRYKLAQTPGRPRLDQTLTPIGECGIEFVVRKLA